MRNLQEYNIKARIPKKLYDEIRKEAEDWDCTESEVIRQALRDFFKRQNPRNFDLAIDALYSLMKKGPREFVKKLKEENGHERR